MAETKGSSADLNKTLMHAVGNKDENFVEQLIESGADINATDKHGATPLFYAVVVKANERMVEKLIQCGADVNANDKHGQTALFFAVLVPENEKLVEKLIECGADVKATNKDGGTALFDAVRKGNEKNLETLTKCGADINARANNGKTALFCAVEKQNEKMVKKLIECGADINASAKNGKTALSYAVQKENETIVDMLMNADADINISSKNGKTPLFYAVENNNEKLVDKLIKSGANVKATDKDGATALFYAVNNENGKSVGKTIHEVRAGDICLMSRILIEDGGAQVDARDRYGRTPLFHALADSLSLARYLLDKGASLHLDENCSVLTFFIETCFFSSPENTPNLQNRLNFLTKQRKVERNTILEAIASVAFCKFFCLEPGSYGIDVDLLSKLMRLASEYTSSLKLPRSKGKRISEIRTMIKNHCHGKKLIESRAPLDIIQLLIKLGANPDTTNSDGNTALHHTTQLAFHGVTQESVLKMCQQLKKLNVSFNIANHENETPLLYCLTTTIEMVSIENEPWPVVKTQADVCRFLVEHGSSVKAKTRKGENVLHLIIKLLQQGLLKCNTELRKNICGLTLHLATVLVNTFSEQKVSIYTQDKDGNTPHHLLAKLQLTSEQDYSSAVTERNARSQQNDEFQTSLRKIYKQLCKSKTHLNVKNKNGETPLHLCRTWTAVELLLETGANPNELDLSGRPPLLAAAKSIKPHLNPRQFFPDVLQEPKAFWRTAVLEKHLDPWTVDNHGESLMSILIETKSFDLAKGMIEFACEDNSPDCGKHIFSLLCAVCKESTSAQEKTDLVQIILESEKCPVSGKKGEDSPLHFCCRNIVDRSPLDVDGVHWAIAKKLLLYEANYEIPNSTGESCLEIAEKCPKLKELLMKPIDINKVPSKIKPWTPISENHNGKLAKVARGRQSKHVKPYWYHKEVLALGSFGAVFAGINEKDGREVAIKRIETKGMQLDEDKLEIQNLLEDCEQIVRYLFFFEDDTFSYIILELMEGNLDHLLEPSIQMDTKLSLCQDVLKGLKFLHTTKNYSILHRDLKPTKILYKTHPKLCLKIAYFDLSCLIDCTSTTVSGTNAEPRCWIAPEVLKSTTEDQHSTASDMFSFGLVLHYILSVKKHPFSPKDCANKDEMQIRTETVANIKHDRKEGRDTSLSLEATNLVEHLLESEAKKRLSANDSLTHPLFWSKTKKVDLLSAVGNQPEFECPRAKRTLPLTAVETDLEASFGTIVKYVDWNDPRYLQMPAIYKEMTKKRTRYKTHSVVELVRFIRNAYAHVSENTRPTPIRKLLLEDFVFLEYFPNLVIEVYNAVTTHGWNQKREEIKYAMNK